MRFKRCLLVVSSFFGIVPGAHAEVFGTDFDAVPVGRYPIGVPGMIEILEGDPASVRIGTADDIPPGYRALARAGWIRSGHFLLVDARAGGDVLLRVAFCRGIEAAPCVLRYEELEIGTGRTSRRSVRPPREGDRAACACSGQIRYEEVRIEKNSLTLFDDFSAAAPDRDQESTSGTLWGGDLLGTDPTVLSLGPFPFVTEPSVRLLTGDPSSVRIVPAQSAVGTCWVSGYHTERKLVIVPSDSIATSVSFDLRLQDDPSAHGILDQWIVAVCGNDVTYRLDDTAAEPLRQNLTRDLGVADGQIHRLIVRVGPSCVVGLRSPRIYLKPRPTSVTTQVQKWEADSLISVHGPKEVYRQAVQLARGDYDEQCKAAVMILAAYGRATPIWEHLGWETGAHASASWKGPYSLVWAQVASEFGRYPTQMDYCLFDEKGGPRWIQPASKTREPQVSSAGVVGLPQVTDSTVTLVLIQRDGSMMRSRSMPRRRGGWGMYEDWEAFRFSPDGSECLLTAHGGGSDSVQTNLVAMDASGRELWARELGVFGPPGIAFSADGKRIVIDDLSPGYHRSPRVMVLSRRGEEIRSYPTKRAIAANEHEVYFADDQLRCLDRRKPDEAPVADPSKLYSLLPQYMYTQSVIDLLLATVPSRFTEDPRLVETLRAMREDPNHRRQLFELDEKLRATADSAQGR